MVCRSQPGTSGARDVPALKPYYQDSSCTIYHGDSRQILPELHPVDVVITDPPYFGCIDSRDVKAGVQAEYAANTAVALHIASQMAPAMVVVTSPSAGAALKVIRELPFVETFRWDCQEELVAVHAFGEGRIGTWNGLVGGPRIPIPLEVTRRLYEPFAPGTLLDPFMGYGSSLVAAVQAGGNAIGIDIEESCCEKAAKAAKAAKAVEALDGYRTRSASESTSTGRNG